MDKILGNKFLLASLISSELTRDLSDNLEYNYDSAYDDINTSIKEYYNSMTLDRRAIAIGTDGHMLSHELFNNPQIGWKQSLYLCTDYFSLMMANVKKPKNALINGPDKNFTLVAALATMGCKLTFLNNKYLNNFELFVLNNPEYPFDIEYEVIEQEDIHGYSGLKFDFMTLGAGVLLFDDELINSHIDALEVGGVIHLINTNDNSEIYGENYAHCPSYRLFEVIDDYPNITTYHVPFGIGHNFIIKN